MIKTTAKMFAAMRFAFFTDTMLDYPTDLLENIYKPAYQNHPMTKWVAYLKCLMLSDCFNMV